MKAKTELKIWVIISTVIILMLHFGVVNLMLLTEILFLYNFALIMITVFDTLLIVWIVSMFILYDKFKIVKRD